MGSGPSRNKPQGRRDFVSVRNMGRQGKRGRRGVASEENAPGYFYLQPTGIPHFDQVLTVGADPLKVLEDTNQSLVLAKEELEGALSIKDCLKDPTLSDCAMTLLFCYSASSNGDLTQLSFTHTNRCPYLHLKWQQLNPELHDLPHLWEHYMQRANVALPRMEGIEELVEYCYNDSRSFGERFEELAREEGLVRQELTTARRNTEAAVEKFREAYELFHSTLELAKSVLEDMEDINEQLKDDDIQREIQRIGTEAYSESIVTPSDVILRHWPEEERKLTNQLRRRRR